MVVALCTFRAMKWHQFLSFCLVLAACGKDTAGPPEPAVDPGRMRVQISGAVQLTSEWQSFGQFRDILATDVGDVSGMIGQNQQPSTGDSSFTLQLPGRLATGHFTIGRYVPGVVPTVPVVSVLLNGPAAGFDDAKFFASLPGGTLEVTADTYPPRPGLDVGVVRGTLTFNAVGLVAGPGGVPMETGDTITVHATFAAHWYHYIFPNVSVTLSGGGPVLGTSQFTTALSSDDDHGGRFVSWESDFGASHTFPHDISQELRVVAPSAGTFPVAAITPTQWADAAQWPAIYSALFYRDDPRLALSTGGTLTVTQFVAPTDDFYGEIHGTLTSHLALWSDSTTLSGDTVNASVTFAVQLWPLGGIPASPRLSWRDAARNTPVTSITPIMPRSE